VRLIKGNFETAEVVGADPVAVARTFAEAGFSRLHLVDLDGARMGRPQHLPLLTSIARSTGLSIDFSGGLRSEADVAQALEGGATAIVVGSKAVTDPDGVCEWIARFGAESVIVGLDVLDGSVRINGWSEAVPLSISQVLERFEGSGLRRVMSTDIGKDGMLQGPSVEMYREFRRRYPEIQCIASGGVANVDDINALAQVGVSEVVVGKALYAGTLTLAAAEEYIW
jgi:phosphoribosylformimino-5-aminoimidazole carboxamide ribotide isomerase